MSRPDMVQREAPRSAILGTMEPDDVLRDVQTPLGFQVRMTRSRWAAIVEHKHPIMRGREVDVRAVLGEPEEVRRRQGNSYGAGEGLLRSNWQHSDRLVW